MQMSPLAKTLGLEPIGPHKIDAYDHHQHVNRCAYTVT